MTNTATWPQARAAGPMPLPGEDPGAPPLPRREPGDDPAIQDPERLP